MNIYTLWLLFAASICTQIFGTTAYLPSGDGCQNVPAYCCTNAGNAGGNNQAPGGGMYGGDPYGGAQAGANSGPYGSDPYGGAQAGANSGPYGSDPYGGAIGGNSGPYGSDPNGGAYGGNSGPYGSDSNGGAQMGADSGPYGGGVGGDYGGGSFEASAYASAAIQGGDPNSAAALAGIVSSGSSSVSGIAFQG
ncbi:glycine-rich cell wall structural protein 1.8-like [Teleopsis dalmanni]|uniref:glycine-rich cell wall structural protein 1.8-like n=1 Tax=Teleopsis dalmanni TaxID=139649 RepID=UPI0018CF0217|nr:glycine-rich cell wall structural protein 1.8-like [Teleopsis dalmanni]